MKKILTFSGVALALAFLGYAERSLTGSLGPDPLMAIEAEPMFFSECVECYDCGIDMHSTSNLPPYLPYFDLVEDECVLEQSCDHVLDCEEDLSPEMAGRLFEGLESLDGEKLISVLALYSENVEFNAERNSFQVRNCGNLVGNIPLNPAQALTMANN